MLTMYVVTRQTLQSQAPKYTVKSGPIKRYMGYADSKLWHYLWIIILFELNLQLDLEMKSAQNLARRLCLCKMGAFVYTRCM